MIVHNQAKYRKDRKKTEGAFSIWKNADGWLEGGRWTTDGSASAKTECVIFTRRKYIREKKKKIKIDNQNISVTKFSKFLGMYIDYILNYIARGIGVILKVEDTLTREVYWFCIIVSYTPSWCIAILYRENL